MKIAPRVAAALLFCVMGEVRADIRRPDDPPRPVQTSEEPARSQPGSCGTGASLAIGGIALAWAVGWVGYRMVRRSHSPGLTSPET